MLAQATALDASLLYASSLLANAKAQLCAWSGLAEQHEAIRRGLEANSDLPVNAFAALAMPLSPQLQLQVARRWAGEFFSREYRTRGSG